RARYAEPGTNGSRSRRVAPTAGRDRSAAAAPTRSGDPGPDRRPDGTPDRRPVGHRGVDRRRSPDGRHQCAHEHSPRRADFGHGREDMNEQAEQPTAAKKARLEAARWLQQRAFWNWNDEQQVEFERWLAASPSHQVAYFRAKAVWERTERLTAFKRPGNPPSITASRARWPLAASAAAIIAVACVAGGAFFGLFGNSDQTTFVTALGERRVLTLADGSQIELNTSSKLRLDHSQREAWLDSGEAYFQIVHDAQRPFSVVVGGKRVEDLGTKFLVHAEGEKFTVSLFEGRAAIKASETGRG